MVEWEWLEDIVWIRLGRKAKRDDRPDVSLAFRMFQRWSFREVSSL